MVERLMDLLPSIIVLFIVAVSSFGFFETAISRCIRDQDHNKFEAFQRWAKDNRKKAYFAFHLPTLLLFSPSKEELMFRVPLLVLFGSISALAWLGIIMSAMAFSLVHYSSPLNDPIFEATSKNEDEDKKRGLRKIKRARAMISLIFGIMIGYLGVRYQSLWLCASIHASWNLVMAVILPFLIHRLRTMKR